MHFGWGQFQEVNLNKNIGYQGLGLCYNWRI